MIEDFSLEHLQAWLESKEWQYVQYIHGIPAEKLQFGKIPDIVTTYLQSNLGLQLGDYCYSADGYSIFRTGEKIKPPYVDRDKDVLLIRIKSNGSRQEITRRDIKIALGEAEILQKPDHPIHRGN